MKFDPNLKAKLFIENIHTPEEISDKNFYETGYQEIFMDEGERKIKKLVQRVRKFEQEGRINLEKTGYLSLGGADGSEVKAFLELTPAKYGVLIEISEFGTEIARNHAKTLSQQNKEFKVIQGDAISELSSAMDFFKSKGCTCLVVSAQAILHELPDRSEAFVDWNRFFAKVFNNFSTTLLFAREPCFPNDTDWGGEVEFKIDGMDGENLSAMVKAVGARIGYFKSPSEGNKSIECMGNGYVISPGDLAVETLHKYLRSNDLTSFKYELGEQLTSFDADGDIKQLLIKHCGNSANVAISFLTTSGFGEVYDSEGVEARKPSGQGIQKPKTHAEIEAFQFEGATKIVSGIRARHIEPDPPSFLIEDGTSNIPAASVDEFYNCVYQGISAIAAELDITRSEFAEFVKNIKKSLSTKGTTTTHFVNGSFGTGKSVFVDRLRWRLRSEDCRVFRVDPLSIDYTSTSRELAKFMRHTKKDIVLVFDNANDIVQSGWNFLDDVRSSHWLNEGKSITVIASDNWAIRRGLSPLSRQNRQRQDKMITVGKLSRAEIVELLSKVVQAEQDGKFEQVMCHMSEQKRLKVCLEDQDRNVVHILIKIRYGLNVNTALNHEIESIDDSSFVEFYKTVVLLNSLGVGSPKFLRDVAIANVEPETSFARLERNLIPWIEQENWVRHNVLLSRLQNIFFDDKGDRAIAIVQFLNKLNVSDVEQRNFLVSYFSNGFSIASLKSFLARSKQPIFEVVSAIERILDGTSDNVLIYHAKIFVGRLYKDVLQDFEKAGKNFSDAYVLDQSSPFLIGQMFWNSFQASDFVSAEQTARTAISLHSENYTTLTAAAFVMRYCSIEGFRKAGEIYEKLSLQGVLASIEERRLQQYREAQVILEAMASTGLTDQALDALKAPRSVWKTRKGASKHYKNALKRELGNSLQGQRLNPEEAHQLILDANEFGGKGGDRILKGLILAHAARFSYEDWYQNDAELNQLEVQCQFEEAEKLLNRDPFVSAWKGTFFKEAMDDFDQAKDACEESLRKQRKSDLDFVKLHPMPHNNMALLYANGFLSGRYQSDILSKAHFHAVKAMELMDQTNGEFSWPVETLAEIVMLAKENGVNLPN